MVSYTPFVLRAARQASCGLRARGNGHAFHTYSLTSGDGNVEFQIRHNVAGRSTYAEGTVDACVFLASRAAAAAPQTLYDMVDVLKLGAM